MTVGCTIRINSAFQPVYSIVAKNVIPGNIPGISPTSLPDVSVEITGRVPAILVFQFLVKKVGSILKVLDGFIKSLKFKNIAAL